MNATKETTLPQETSLNSLAIVIPVFRDRDALAKLLAQLASARVRGAEIIVAGTHDDSSIEAVALYGADLYLRVVRGRGIQLARGAAATSRDMLWFLHADTELPHDAAQIVCEALKTNAWGRFDVTFDDGRLTMRLVAAMMNWRSRVTGIATGDQGIFVRRKDYEAAGGFEAIPLMEDIALSRSLLASATGGAPACVRRKLVVSARKWQRDGILRTIVRMWWWRFRYWRGAHPETLAREYYGDTP
jgi:rSAM/selenodomain-associated transferase 2